MRPQGENCFIIIIPHTMGNSFQCQQNTHENSLIIWVAWNDTLLIYHRLEPFPSISNTLKDDCLHTLPMSCFNSLQLSVKNCFIRGSVVRYVQLPADEVDTQLLQDAARKEAMQQKQWWTCRMGFSLWGSFTTRWIMSSLSSDLISLKDATVCSAHVIKQHWSFSCTFTDNLIAFPTLAINNL